MADIKVEFIQTCKYFADSTMASSFARKLGGNISVSKPLKDSTTDEHLTSSTFKVKVREYEVQAAAKELGYYACKTDGVLKVTNSREVAKRGGYPGVYFVPPEVMAP